MESTSPKAPGPRVTRGHPRGIQHILNVIKSGVRLLTTLKPIKRQGWWKGKFALFKRLATRAGGGGQGWTRVQRPPPPHWQSMGKSFYRWREGATRRNGTGSSDRHLETGHAVVWPASSWLFWVRLILSSRVGLFLFLWGQFSELWQLMSWLQSGHCVVKFFHLLGVSVSTTQLTGYGSEYYLKPLRRN